MKIKRVFYVFVVIIFLAVVGEFGYFYYSDTQRSSSQTNEIIPRSSPSQGTVYAANDYRSRFPGSGAVTIDTAGQIRVVPKNGGKMFYAPIAKKDDYENNKDYTVVVIPETKGVLVYMVGTFKQWEDMVGTQDKIMVVTDPQNQAKEYKFRVAFEKSDLFGLNNTHLAVEDMDLVEAKVKKTTEEFSTPLADIGFDNFKKAVQKNDIVILAPVYEPPFLNKKDENGIMLASWVNVRREGGKTALAREMGAVDVN